MAVVACPICEFKVNAQAAHCPQCGADLRLDRREARLDLEARGIGAPLPREVPPDWRWRTSVLVALIAPLVVGATLAAASIIAALAFAMLNQNSDGYTAGLSGLLALFIIVPCGVQLIAYGDGAMAIFHRRVSRAVWGRITTEVVTACVLVLMITVPLARSPFRIAWLLVVLPVVGAYLLIVGFLVVRPRASARSGVGPH